MLTELLWPLQAITQFGSPWSQFKPSYLHFFCDLILKRGCLQAGTPAVIEMGDPGSTVQVEIIMY